MTTETKTYHQYNPPSRPATPTLDRMQAPHVGGWTRRTKGEIDPATGEPSEGYEPCRLVDHSNMVGEFIDWMQARGLVLARYADVAEVELVDGDVEEAKDVLVPDPTPTRKLLADYFEVDEDEAERERMALLDYVRQGGR